MMNAGRIIGSGKRRVSRNIVKILNINDDYRISSTEGNQHSYSKRNPDKNILVPVKILGTNSYQTMRRTY